MENEPGRQLYRKHMGYIKEMNNFEGCWREIQDPKTNKGRSSSLPRSVPGEDTSTVSILMVSLGSKCSQRALLGYLLWNSLSHTWDPKMLETTFKWQKNNKKQLKKMMGTILAQNISWTWAGMVSKQDHLIRQHCHVYPWSSVWLGHCSLSSWAEDWSHTGARSVKGSSGWGKGMF